MVYEYLLQTAITIAIAWIAAIIIQKIFEDYITPLTNSPDLVNFLKRALKSFIYFLAFLSILNNTGINIQGIIAGLGITGFAFGFALKDALANTIAGVFILLYQPFKVGQFIEVPVSSSIINQGTVVKIDLRYTTLENKNNFVLIPNSILFTNAITITK